MKCTQAPPKAGCPAAAALSNVQSPSLGKPKLFYDGPVPGWEKEGSR